MTATRTTIGSALAVATLFSAISGTAHIFTDWLPLKPVGYIDPFGHDTLVRYTDVTAKGGIAWLATRDRGVAVIELPPSGKPVAIANYSPSPLPVFTSVAVNGTTGYFATANDGIHVVDLEAEPGPRQRGQIDPSAKGFDRVSRLALHGETLFAVGPDSPRIAVFDVHQPHRPVRVQTLDTAEVGELRDVVVAGDHLYVAGTRGRDGRGAVYIYALSDLERSPRILATGPDTASADATPDERFLVVSHDRRGGTVSIHDLAAPDPAAALEEIGAADYEINTFGPSRVRVKDQVAYVAWHQGGVQLIDLDTVDITGKTQRVGVFGTAPGISPLAGAAGNVGAYPFVSNDRVLLVDTRWGLYVVDARHVLPVALEAAE